MNREIRRVFARQGIKVKRLKRVRLGSLNLGPLAEGEYRTLSSEEIERLKRAAQAAVPKEKHDAEEE